ncbi:MAG: hypothetical protein D6806_16085 [Deltaproteobacteria bacterium]|nr:MAG: hypothetical protein D6806_16085 [Deltaproteobacteria bacterium]
MNERADEKSRASQIDSTERMDESDGDFFVLQREVIVMPVICCFIAVLLLCGGQSFAADNGGNPPVTIEAKGNGEIVVNSVTVCNVKKKKDGCSCIPSMLEKFERMASKEGLAAPEKAIRLSVEKGLPAEAVKSIVGMFFEKGYSDLRLAMNRSGKCYRDVKVVDLSLARSRNDRQASGITAVVDGGDCNVSVGKGEKWEVFEGLLEYLVESGTCERVKWYL